MKHSNDTETWHNYMPNENDPPLNPDPDKDPDEEVE